MSSGILNTSVVPIPSSAMFALCHTKLVGVGLIG